MLATGVVAGCGTGEEGARSTLAPIQATTYVTVEAPTTTTTTTPPPPPTAPSGQVVVEQEQVYTVVAGDNLYKIATRFEITLDELLAYNGITADHFLMPGQTTLKIPAGSVSAGGAVPTGSTPPPANGTAGTTTTEAPGAGCVHVVVEGDYQGKVAQQYGVSLDELAAANADNPAWNHFQLGSEITIPAGGSC
jgi:LysM repeat protein